MATVLTHRTTVHKSSGQSVVRDQPSMTSGQATYKRSEAHTHTGEMSEVMNVSDRLYAPRNPADLVTKMSLKAT